MPEISLRRITVFDTDAQQTTRTYRRFQARPRNGESSKSAELWGSKTPANLEKNNRCEFHARPQPSSGAASQITSAAPPFAPLRGGRSSVEKHHYRGQKAHVVHSELRHLLSWESTFPGGFIADLHMEVSSTAASKQGSGKDINKKPCFEKLRKQFRSG